FFSSRRRHTRFSRDWSSDVCSSDLRGQPVRLLPGEHDGTPQLLELWQPGARASGPGSTAVVQTGAVSRTDQVPVRTLPLLGAVDVRAHGECGGDVSGRRVARAGDPDRKSTRLNS